MYLTMGNLPPLTRFKPFEAAARHESFSLAASELGMTQTAVSKQIAQLEAELDIALFERRNRAVFLTDEGRRLGRVVSAALGDIAVEVATLCGQRRVDELVLHCQLCEAFYWLMPRLAGFHQMYPDIELRVVTSLKPVTQAEEQFDVAMQSTDRPSGTVRPAFTASDDIFPVCAPDFVPDRSHPLAPGDMLTYPLLSHQVVPQDWMEWAEWFDTIGCPIETRPRLIHFDSYPLALQAAVAGQGIALGWRRTTENLLKEGKLVRPCCESVHRPADLSVFRGTSRARHKDTDKLIAWLASELSD